MIDHPGVELDALLLQQVGTHLVRRKRGLVRPRRRERVPDVDDRDDARAERDRLAGEALRVAGPVPALVVVAHAGERVGREAVDARDDAVADVGVALHLAPLVRREAAGLQQDLVADADLADVVEQRAEPDRLDLLAPRARGARPSASREREPPAVQLGVAVARLDGARDRLDRGVEGRAQALDQPQVLDRERDLRADGRDRAELHVVERVGSSRSTTSTPTGASAAKSGA